MNPFIQRTIVIFYLSVFRRGRDRSVVDFATTYTIWIYHHWCWEFESCSGWGVQHYVIKFVSVLRQVGGFLRVLRFPPPIKLTATIRYNWNFVESVVKHHKPSFGHCIVCPLSIYIFRLHIFGNCTLFLLFQFWDLLCSSTGGKVCLLRFWDFRDNVSGICFCLTDLDLFLLFSHCSH